ncbi:recombinase family protein [Streptomyces sp. NBC_01725]|uniref:recombinase family protein n=1 Tax=Streptomyces sp. NBC_01725 TaxID=2975923 RepID=UPI002E2CB556|nr:recombinase family protein [Streptomyces sp. NBC_01725]
MPVAPEYLHLVYPDEEFRAFLYGRASHDPTKRGRSVDSQLVEGREMCETHGWPIVGVFDKDVDRSASRHARTRRTDFEAMLEGIRASECRIVVAWEASRYYRDLEAYVRLRAACLEGGVLLCYNGQIFDLSKRADRKATARDALDAEDEGEGIHDRNERTHRRLAAEGKPVSRIPWGYARRYDTATGDLLEQYEHPVRGPFVVSMFKRLVEGWARYRIARWLNTEPDAALEDGKEWDIERVTVQLRNPAYAGRRVHQGKVVRKATWKALVTDELFDRAQEILDDAIGWPVKDRSVKHRYSFVTFCGEHGEDLPKLKVSPARNKYFCPKLDTAMRLDWFEAYVDEAIITWLSSPAAAAAFQRDDQVEDSERARRLLKKLEQQLEEARELASTTDENGDPGLSPASLASMERGLTPKITAARAKVRELTAPVPPLVAKLLEAPDVEKVWDGLLLEQKRTVVRQIVTVRLHKAHAKGTKKILPGRITLAFVGEPGFKAG